MYKGFTLYELYILKNKINFMLNKTGMVILFLLIIAFCTISEVSADDLDERLSLNASVDEIEITEDISLQDVNTSQDNFNAADEILEIENEGTFTELQNMVDEAPEGSTIELERDYKWDAGFKNTYHGVQIQKSLTINGNGHRIDGAYESIPFQAIYAKKVIFNDVNFTHGMYYSQEAPVSGYLEYIGFNNCVFMSNFGSWAGVLLLVNIDKVSFVNCSFIGNGGTLAGGAIFIQAVNESYFDSCKFINNMAYGNTTAGGAVYGVNSGDFYFNSCHFQGSSANKGGTICIEAANSLQINSCDFNNCRAGGVGGALYLHLIDDIKIESSTFNISTAVYGGAIYCDRSNIDLDNVSMEWSVAESYGGVVDAIYSNITVTNSEFIYSAALAEAGGAFYNLKGNLTVINSSFIGSGCAESGGVIASLKSDLVVLGSKFINCKALTYGGAIYSIYGSVLVEESLFNGSSAGIGSAIHSEISDSSIFTNNIFLNYTIAKTAIAVISPKGEVINENNHFENVYYLYLEFVGYLNGEKFKLKSNVLTYVLSNTGTFLNTYRDYEYERDSSDLVSLDFWDPDHPDDSIIYKNYNDLITPSYKFTRYYEGDDYFKYEQYLNYYFIDGNNHILSKGEKNSVQNIQNLTNKTSALLNVTMFVISRFSSDTSLSAQAHSLIESFASDLKSIPSSYDSRNYGYITPVKDQANGGNCWAFSGVATLEACLKKITGIEYDFSEENIKNIMAAYSCFGLNLETNKGGYDSMVLAYLSSWAGPILEEIDEYDGSTLVSGYYISKFPTQNIIFLPARQTALDNDAYKRAIMDYGAVSISLNMAGEGYHAISLVGWDDNYVGLDSLGTQTKGAWIFKNSWGTDWGKSGFGYLSYYNRFANERYEFFEAYTFSFNKNDDYINNYQLENAGVSDYLCYDGSVYYKNIFTSKGYDEYLSAFSTYFKYPTNYIVSVYKGNELVFTQNGYSNAGYYTIPFNERIKLGAYEEFAIVIENSNSNRNYVPVCQSVELNNINFEKGTSFVSYDGRTWYDLYELKDYNEFLFGGFKKNTCQVACLKAFTSRYEELNNVSIEVARFDNVEVGKRFTIDLTLTDLGIYNFDVIEKTQNTYIDVVINGKTYYAKVNDGKAQLNITINNGGSYKLTAQYRNNLFQSNIVQFNFNVKKINTILSATGVSKVYGASGNSIIILKDAKGKLLSNEIVKINLNGKITTLKTNARGQVSLAIDLAPKTYVATVTYAGNGKYESAGASAKIIIKKASAKITAGKKTFKAKVKSKKYTITLKDIHGKVIKNAAVKIKINGKTYNAKTNAKGKATFKITKLTKKGSFKSTVKFSGNAYYNAVSKTVKITVKK